MDNKSKQESGQGVSVLYFEAENENVYAEIKPNKDQAKTLAKRIFRDAMEDLSKTHVTSLPPE